MKKILISAIALLALSQNVFAGQSNEGLNIATKISETHTPKAVASNAAKLAVKQRKAAIDSEMAAQSTATELAKALESRLVSTETAPNARINICAQIYGQAGAYYDSAADAYRRGMIQAGDLMMALGDGRMQTAANRGC